MHGKKYTKKRRPKRYKKNKHPSNKQLAKRIRHLESETELKYEDFLTSQTVSTTGLAAHMCIPAQGDNITQRTGERIYCTSLQFKMNLSTVTGSIASSLTRVIVLIDKFPAQSAPLTQAGAVTYLGANGLLDNSIITEQSVMPRAYQMRGRYKILYDKVFPMNPQVMLTATTTVPSTHHIVKNFRMGHQMVFQGATGTAASLVRNVPIVFVIGASTNVTYNVGARMYFKDA